MKFWVLVGLWMVIWWCLFALWDAYRARGNRARWEADHPSLRWEDWRHVVRRR